jgi:hypothetical protein
LNNNFWEELCVCRKVLSFFHDKRKIIFRAVVDLEASQTTILRQCPYFHKPTREKNHEIHLLRLPGRRTLGKDDCCKREAAANGGRVNHLVKTMGTDLPWQNEASIS